MKKKARKPTAAARASVDSLIQQINKKHPSSLTTASRLLDGGRGCKDEALSPSKPNSKSPGMSTSSATMDETSVSATPEQVEAD